MVVCLAARRIWTHGVGGMESHCRSLAGELVRQGHAVHVVTTAHPDGLREEVRLGARVHYLPGTPPGDYSRAWWRASRRWTLEHVDRLGVDVILSMSVAGTAMADARNNLPVFYIVHGYGWPQLRSYWHDSPGWQKLVRFPRGAASVLAGMLWARRALPKAAGVLAVSHELFGQLRGYQTCFLPNVVDTTLFRPDPGHRAQARAALDIADADTVALMVGTVNWQKGVDLGLRACAEVAMESPHLRLLVVGDGPALAPLAKWARAEAPHLRVSFVGSRPHEALPSYYVAADIFLFPSRRQEGLPTTVLEAMATGLPVIATRSGGTPTAVLEGETGLLTPIDDHREFVVALRVLVRDAARREALGAGGRKAAQEIFDTRLVVARLVGIMKGVGC